MTITMRRMNSDPSLAILISDQARERFETPILRILNGRPVQWVGLQATPDAQGHYPVDLAFLSRDVTGSSSKTVLTPTLERYYDILRHSPRLAWIQMHSAGADRPIYQEMLARGVVVTSGSGANAKPVAQMALAGLLALARRLPVLMDSQRRRAWEPLLGPKAPKDLSGQTVMVVGWGPIGQEIGRLCKELGMRVIGVRREPHAPSVADEFIAYAEVTDHLPRADWVVLACPLNDNTRGLLNSASLSLLPPGAHIINVSRGEVIDEPALLAALQAGQVGGAFLDVFVKEPLDPASPLWSLPQVMISPHSAGHTQGHYQAVAEIFFDNLGQWLAGQPMRNLVT